MALVVVCGFQWRDYPADNPAHLHECQIPEEHDERNRDHVCYCGDSKECRFGEISYQEGAILLSEMPDEECPF